MQNSRRLKEFEADKTAFDATLGGASEVDALVQLSLAKSNAGGKIH